MSVLVNKQTKVMVQGITGLQATFHVKRAIELGTNIVAGTSPRQNLTEYLGLPVYKSVSDLMQETKAQADIIFTPARFVKDSVKEAAEAGIQTIVSIAYGVPVHDMLEIKAIVKANGTRFIGPNTPGVITPSKACLGIYPDGIYKEGSIGIVSRSSTLTYEAVLETSKAGLGQSTVVGLGDDIIIGTDFKDIVSLFNADSKTKAVLLIGSLGGTYEEEFAQYYQSLTNKKKVVAYVAGSDIPFNENMGYASDIITRGKITVADKKRALENAGIVVAESLTQIGKIFAELQC